MPVRPGSMPVENVDQETGVLYVASERGHSVNNANSAVAERFNGLVAGFLATNGDTALAAKQAWASLSGTLSNQAYVLAFADAFIIIAAVLGVSALLVLMLPPLHSTIKRGGAGIASAPPLMNPANVSGSWR